MSPSTRTVLLAAVILLPKPAAAQTPASEGFLGLLTKNDSVIVVTKTGDTIPGRLTEIAAESIAVSRRGARLRTLSRSDVLEVKKSVPDSLWNGALIGAAVGFAGTFLACLGTFEDGFVISAEGAAFAMGLLFGAPGGLLAGLVADSASTKKVTLYRASEESGSRVRVAPILTPSRVGVGVAVRLGR